MLKHVDTWHCLDKRFTLMHPTQENLRIITRLRGGYCCDQLRMLATAHVARHALVASIPAVPLAAPLAEWLQAPRQQRDFQKHALFL